MTEPGAFETSKLFEIICLLEEDTPNKSLETITSGADVNITDECGNGYLHLLCGNSELNDTSPAVYVPLMYQLANAGVNVNAQNNNGNTALHFAVTNNVLERVVNVLLKIGSDMNLSNSDGLTPVEMCANPMTLKTFEMFSPGLPAVVRDKNITKLEQLIKCWCYSKHVLTDEGIVDSDDVVDDEKDFSNLLKQGMEKTAFIHATLAGDRPRMRTTYRRDVVDVNAEDHSYINSKGDIRPVPLLIEAINMNLVEAVKFLIKKKVNVNMEFSFRHESSGPFFHYFASTCPPKRQETLALVMKMADVSLLNGNIGIEFLYRLWSERFPEEILGKYVQGGISLNVKDANFYTLRDRVLMDSLSCDTKTRKQNLYYVDQHLLGLVETGNLDSIKKLFQDGYDHILIENPQGRNSLSVARKANQTDMVSFLEALPTLQKEVRCVRKAIELGNLSRVKEVCHDAISDVRDKAARTILHRTVLFERRFIVNFLLKQYLSLINLVDLFGRTALHYACMLVDGTDFEGVLLQAGADPNITDVMGKTPADYKTEPLETDYIERERGKDYGIELYLVERYFQFSENIEKGFKEKLMRLKDSMFDDLTFNDLERISPEMRERIGYRNLLFQCIDKKREDIAIYLVHEGANPIIEEVVDDHMMSLEHAAEKRDMSDLIKLIKKHKARLRFERRAEMLIENITGRPNTSFSDSSQPRTSSSSGAVSLKSAPAGGTGGSLAEGFIRNDSTSKSVNDLPSAVKMSDVKSGACAIL